MSLPETPPNHMSFWEHLQELRVRLVRSLVIILVAFALTYAFRFRIWDWVQRPFLAAMARQTHQAVAQLQPWACLLYTSPSPRD